MKNLILTALVISLGLLAVGCANNKKVTPKNESVTELNTPVAPREGGYAAAPAPAPTAAPIYVEPAVTQTPAAAAASPAPAAAAAGAGSSYTVKKGDTLFSI